MFNHLFCRPKYNHYYFGDYYDGGYQRAGILPWFEFVRTRGGYSPFCQYLAWDNERHHPHWLNQVRQDWEARRERPDLRPPHTYETLEAQIRRLPDQERAKAAMAQPLGVFATRSQTAFKFERTKENVREKFVQQESAHRNLARERAHWESPFAGRQQETQPRKVIIPRTKIVETAPGPAARTFGGREPSAEMKEKARPPEQEKSKGFFEEKRDRHKETRPQGFLEEKRKSPTEVKPRAFVLEKPAETKNRPAPGAVVSARTSPPGDLKWGTPYRAPNAASPLIQKPLVERPVILRPRAIEKPRVELNARGRDKPTFSPPAETGFKQKNEPRGQTSASSVEPRAGGRVQDGSRSGAGRRGFAVQERTGGIKGGR